MVGSEIGREMIAPGVGTSVLGDSMVFYEFGTFVWHDTTRESKIIHDLT